jgi:hypothetical protein
VVARLRRELGVDLPLRSVFQTPTLAGLAATVQALEERRQLREPREAPAGRPRLVPVDRGAGRQRRAALTRPGKP